MDQPDRTLTDHLRETARACNSAIAAQATATHLPTREERLGDTPTTSTLADAVQALRTGISSKPMRALIEGMTQGQLKHHLEVGGLECYADCVGNTVIRTIEAGNAHREQVRAERQARAEHARRHAEIVRAEGERNRANGYSSQLRERLGSRDGGPEEYTAGATGADDHDRHGDAQ